MWKESGLQKDNAAQDEASSGEWAATERCIEQSVTGSGFAVALKIDDQSSSNAFSIKGFQLEFTPGGRR